MYEESVNRAYSTFGYDAALLLGVAEKTRCATCSAIAVLMGFVLRVVSKYATRKLRKNNLVSLACLPLCE